jgi:hypothetical protein
VLCFDQFTLLVGSSARVPVASRVLRVVGRDVEVEGAGLRITERQVVHDGDGTVFRVLV